MYSAITLGKVKSSIIEKGKRILTVLQFGAKTSKECGPFGFDSSPLENWTAIYAETSNKDEPVVIGYINRNQLAEVGGSRMYSLEGDGELGAFVYCRASGVLELNGAAYSGVRFQELKTATDNTNTLLNAEFAKIALSVNALAAAVLPAAIYTPASISTNLTDSESPDVKLK